MIYGKLSEFEDLVPGRLSGSVLTSLEWLRALPLDAKEGRYDLDVSIGLYAVVMSYATVLPEASRFESHRKVVDLQYTISGGEGIEWAHTSMLTEDGPYQIENDLQFYCAREPSAIVENLPGYFSIYTPTDAHRPKIRLVDSTDVFKVVVKIPVQHFQA